MGPLLTAVRDRLKDQVPALGGRVYAVAEESLLPQEAAFPCGTVRDGGTELIESNTAQRLARHSVIVSLYVSNLRDVEAPVLGDGATPGIEALTDESVTALTDWIPAAPANLLDAVRPVAIGPTELFLEVEGAREIVRKGVTWLYRQKPSI